MQGLVDYGSDSGGEDAPAPGPSPLKAPSEPAPRKGLLSALPPPSTSAAPKASDGLLSSLHAPGGAKKVVQFLAPIRPPADDDDDEDTRPKKVAKTAPAKTGGAASLFASLPKPKNDDLGGAAALGGGGAKLDLSDKPLTSRPAPAAPAVSPFAEGLQGDDDDDDDGGGGNRAAAASAEEGPQAHTVHPSDMYRVTDGGQPAYAVSGDPGTSYEAHGQAYDPEAWAQWAAANPEAAAAYAAQQGWYAYGYGDASQHQQQEAPVSADALLQKALMDQAAHAARKKDFDPFAALSAIPVKEISQKELTKGREHLVQTQSVTGMAFGPEYEAKLRREAGAKPDARLRAKHQIGTLYWQSKQNELQMLEGRLQGMKTKAETQAKYGWR